MSSIAKNNSQSPWRDVAIKEGAKLRLSGATLQAQRRQDDSERLLRDTRLCIPFSLWPELECSTLLGDHRRHPVVFPFRLAEA